jgi:hypothetical protein
MTIQPLLPESLAAALLQVDFTQDLRRAGLHERLRALGVPNPAQLEDAARKQGLLFGGHDAQPALALTPRVAQLAAPHYLDPEARPFGPPRPVMPCWGTQRHACADTLLSYFCRGERTTPYTAITVAQLHGVITRPEPTKLGAATAAVTAAPTNTQAQALTRHQDAVVLGLCAPGNGPTEFASLVALRLELRGPLTRVETQHLLLGDDVLAPHLLLLYGEPRGRYLTLLLEAKTYNGSLRYATAWRYYRRLIHERYGARELWVCQPRALSPDAFLPVWADPLAYINPDLLLPDPTVRRTSWIAASGEVAASIIESEF